MSEGRRSLPARMPELYEEYEERDTPSTHPLRREARGAHFHHSLPQKLSFRYRQISYKRSLRPKKIAI